MDRHELFNNLIIMAAIDGKLTDSEISILAERAARWGISKGEVAAALEYARDADAEMVFSGSRRQQVKALQDLADMMAADGELAEVEKKLFTLAAAAMGLSPDEVHQMFRGR